MCPSSQAYQTQNNRTQNQTNRNQSRRPQPDPRRLNASRPCQPSRRNHRIQRGPCVHRIQNPPSPFSHLRQNLRPNLNPNLNPNRHSHRNHSHRPPHQAHHNHLRPRQHVHVIHTLHQHQLAIRCQRAVRWVQTR